MQRKTKARSTATFKTRYEPPTLAEAIAAAQGLAPDIEGQTEIAASLMGVTVEEAAAEIKKLSTRRKPITLTSTDRKGMARAVVVERRPSRTLVMNRGAASR